MYTAKDIERYTRQLAKLGITGEAEVDAVLAYIHQAVCIAVKVYRRLESQKEDNENDNAA